MRVLLLHAHPDDETLASGVLIAELAARGDEVFVLTATRGEMGEVADPALSHLFGTDELSQVRESELAGALAELGVTGHAYLGTPPARAAGEPARVYRDSGMTWVTPTVAGPADDTDPRALSVAPLAEQVADTIAYCESIRPDLVISYDADGGYGHPDHVRMHEVLVQLAAETGVPAAVLTYANDEGVDWYDLPHRLPSALAALNHHRTQLRVDGADVIHSGGQREAVVTAVGLRPVEVDA